MSEPNIPDEIEKRHTALRGANVTTYYKKAYRDLAAHFNALSAERDDLHRALIQLQAENAELKRQLEEAVKRAEDAESQVALWMTQ